MALITETIKPGGGGDRLSRSAWEAAFSGATNDFLGHGADAVVDTTTVVMNFSTSGTITMDASPGFECNGQQGVGTRLVVTGAAANGMDILVPMTCLDTEIACEPSNAAGGYCYLGNSGSGTRTAKRCLFRRKTYGNATGSIGWNGGTWNFFDCALIVNTTGTAGNFGGIVNFGGTGNCYGVTVVVTLNSGSAGAGFVSCNVQNCMGGNGDGHATNGYFLTCTAIGNGYNLQTYNLAAPGTNEWHNIQLSTLLANVTAGSEDPRWTSYATMTTYAGNDYSATSGSSLSLENHTRLSTWYIGASYAYPAAPTWTTAAGLPDGTVGVAYDQDVTGTGTGTLTITEVGGTLTPGLNFTDNGDGTGTFDGTPADGTDTSRPLRRQDAWGQYADRTFTITVAAPVITCSTSTLAMGDSSIGVAGAPSAARAASVSPNADITVAAAGTHAAKIEIATDADAYATWGSSKTITNSGNFKVRIKASATGAGAISASVTLNSTGATEVVVPLSGTLYAAPAISTTSLPAGVVGVAYSQTVVGTVGAGAKTFTISVGSLPAGLSIAASTGVVSGTPTTPTNPASFTVLLTDDYGNTASQGFTTPVIAPAPGGGQGSGSGQARSRHR